MTFAINLNSGPTRMDKARRCASVASVTILVALSGCSGPSGEDGTSNDAPTETLSVAEANAMLTDENVGTRIRVGGKAEMASTKEFLLKDGGEPLYCQFEAPPTLPEGDAKGYLVEGEIMKKPTSGLKNCKFVGKWDSE